MINDFQHRLLKALEDKNINASELSRLSGVGKSDISNYLNGVYVAKQDKCYMLAKALDVDPGWLMTGDAPVPELPAAKSPISTSEAIIISGGVDNMPPEKRKQALQIMQVAFPEYSDLFTEHDKG